MSRLSSVVFSALAILVLTSPALCTENRWPAEFDKCGTVVPSQATMDWVEHELQMLRNLKALPPCDNVVIPVHFHVIHNGASAQLTSQQVQDQIDVLTAAYTNYTFVLDTLDYTDDPAWFTIVHGSATENAVKSTLARDLLTHLNIYTAGQLQNSVGDPLLGWATFPWEFTGAGDYMDGVVLVYNSLPSGSPPYNEGDTATHEVGHWLGLRHIWGDAQQASQGCNFDDYVTDTPSSQVPNYSCPNPPPTTCGSPDQVENYMDYGYDNCLYLFTTGQFERMCMMTELYRGGIAQTAQLCGNTTVDAGEQCDDGNTTSGDGCSSTCQIEGTGSTCTTFAATDTPVTILETPGQMTYRSELTVSTAVNQSTVVDVNILNVQISHAWMGDIDLRVNSAMGTGIQLMNSVTNCAEADVDANFDDEAAPGAPPCPPNTGDTYQPVSPLSTFDGENADGVWTLIVTDHGNEDGGAIDHWEVEVCTSSAGPEIFDDDFESGNLTAWPVSNP